MLDFLYTAVSWVLLRWHQLFTAVGIDKNSGLNWSLSIVFLVITARLILFRFFVKQVHYQRRMQELQPKMTAIREKYKNDRQAQQREMMKFQQEEGFNPLSGCLPMLLQIPVFIGLFHVLRHLANSVNLNPGNPGDQRGLTLYSFSSDETVSAAHAKLFGAPLAATIRDSADRIAQLAGDRTSLLIVVPILAVVSAGATYITQVVATRSATTTPVGTAATVQRLMRYFIPVSVLGSALFFPLGVLLYWFTSNIWTMGQQFYINRFHPPTPAAKPETTAGELGKSLAPRPGAKPVTDRRRNVSLSKPESDRADAGDDAVETVEAGATAVSETRGSSGTVNRTPRPGARPSRPAGSRPSGNRPSKAKKRR